MSLWTDAVTAPNLKKKQPWNIAKHLYITCAKYYTNEVEQSKIIEV